MSMIIGSNDLVDFTISDDQSSIPIRSLSK